MKSLSGVMEESFSNKRYGNIQFCMIDGLKLL